MAQPLQPGDIVLTHGVMWGVDNDGVVNVDPLTGAESLVASIPSGSLRNPSHVDVGPDGDLYVAMSGSRGFFAGIIRVNPSTGAQTTYSVGRGPFGVAVAADGTVYFRDDTPAVMRVTSTTSASVVSSGGLLCSPAGIAIAPNGDLLVADPGPPNANGGIPR